MGEMTLIRELGSGFEEGELPLPDVALRTANKPRDDLGFCNDACAGRIDNMLAMDGN